MIKQPNLFEICEGRLERFDGPDVSPVDRIRLATAMDRVYELMKDGRWRTLKEIAQACRVSEAGASARLRDLRKDRFRLLYKNREVSRQRVSGGLWQYKVVV
jgi:hypothetical protein